ncbi:MAG: G5 domain-containing protein [Ancrocorticia sp.]|uniref:aggregation-promoting factor C-terminal-like domain-containing protein n=1 Tax=Ancrocorticia sp. TaxID=2593684 RepID=UPI003F91B8CB
MGRHSGSVTPDSAQVDLEGTGHIGPRRAALMAERQAADSQHIDHIDVVALTERAQSIAAESGATAGASAAADESAVPAAGSAFVAAPISPDLDSEDLVATYQVKRASAKKNVGVGAVAMIAAVSMFGVAGAVSADSFFSKDDAAGSSNSGVLGTAAIEKTDAPVTFTVEVDGESQTLTSSATTLHDALSEAGIHVNSDDKVSAHMTDPIAEGDTVKIVRVVTESVTEKATDKFTTEEVEDPSLPEGEEVVETKGVNGVSIKTLDVTTEDGKETSSVETMRVVQSEPVNEVVRIGTGEEEQAEDLTRDDSDSDSGNDAPPSVAPSGNPQSIAHSMMASYGWGEDQFSCLVPLWQKESGWNASAANPSSGAYGIPQALPGNKMASAGSDWQTNPATQISWGLSYISDRYGNPCNAWGHSQSVGWY